jgi:hypothetical protein
MESVRTAVTGLFEPVGVHDSYLVASYALASGTAASCSGAARFSLVSPP